MNAVVADGALVARLREGDREAVEHVYIAHHAVIRAFARRFVGDDASAEDIVHDTFVALPRAIRGYRGEGTLRAFLVGVAKSHSRRHVRSAMRRRRATERLAEREQLEPRTIDGTELLARKQSTDALRAALAALPRDQQTVFVLCELENRTSREVGEIVGAPEATVRTRLFHAKRKLRVLLAIAIACAVTAVWALVGAPPIAHERVPVRAPAPRPPEPPARAAPALPKAAPAAATMPREPAPRPRVAAISPGEALYRRAHDLHFHGSDPGAALAAWDDYLAAAPSGRFAIEAKYNRAIELVRLGRYPEARVALSPFARGEIEPAGYRQTEAAELLVRLARHD